ncbi:hypothetical protein [Streptomyces canus]|uniref:hypothetical protein n=1 Tax=Streptomyces canus TaxID=58343 RepID=UPI00216B09C0|nr:hypothetical protein [Streptomyces canus]
MHSRVETDAAAIVTWVNSNHDLDQGSARERIYLKAGDQLDFRIASRTGRFEPGGKPSIGALEFCENRLLVSNFTTSATYVIENLEGGIELVKARPRQLRVAIPFEMSRVLIPSGENITELTVFGSPPPLMREELSARIPGPPMVNVETASKYFAVLVALCEPRLRGSSMAAVPSVQEVVERLRGSSQFRGANRSSINYHINYLADQKLPVNRWTKCVDEGRMHSKREALVAFALRFDIVREEHLDLLPNVAC